MPFLLCVEIQAHPADERSFQRYEIGVEADQLVVLMKLYCGPKLSQRFYRLLNTNDSSEQEIEWLKLVRGETSWLNLKHGDLAVCLEEEDHVVSKLKKKLKRRPSPIELFEYLRERPVQQYHLYRRTFLGQEDAFRGLDLLPSVLEPSYEAEEDSTTWPMLVLPYRYEIPLRLLKLANFPVLKIKTDLLLFSSESSFHIDPSLKKSFHVISSGKVLPDKEIRGLLENKPGSEFKQRQVFIQWKG